MDSRTISSIGTLVAGETQTILGTCVSSRAVRFRGGRTEVTFSDDTGKVRAVWFGQPYLAKRFGPGVRALLTGRVVSYNGLVLQNPEFECLDETATPQERDDLTPIYPLTEGITQRMLRAWISLALDSVGDTLADPLPSELLCERDLPGLRDAMQDVHFPKDLERARRARRRLVYERVLSLQVAVLGERNARTDTAGCAHQTNGPLLSRFQSSLAFDLTAAQRRVVCEVLDDMTSPTPMARLVQGDVGCGKTLVAAHAAIASADGGYQTAILAPTEILAEQHYFNFRDWLQPLGIRVGLVTAASGRSARAEAKSGESQVVVGTHALFQDATKFENLGLVVVDEQHRFGVGQRERLAAKGRYPDVLHLSATPIPRSLAMTVYGGMDISVVDELPPGRMPIATEHVAPDGEAALFAALRERIVQDAQCYFVSPLIEDSESRDANSVHARYQALSSGPLRGIALGLIHGRMSSAEKDAAMRSFKTGDTRVLFATTVIEVGVDVPSATIMIIDNAGEFGLTQLHQLRGRVGRGSQQSFCYLLGEPATDAGRERIDTMCSTSNGFEIAEADLAIRGPGEFFGIRQSGLDGDFDPSLIADVSLIAMAQTDAKRWYEELRAALPTTHIPETPRLRL